MLCPNCETDNDDGARFCNECGFPLAGSISHPAGSASPADDIHRMGRGSVRPAPSWDNLLDDWEKKKSEIESPPNVWAKNVPTRVDSPRVAAAPSRRTIDWDAVEGGFGDRKLRRHEEIEPDFPDFSDEASYEDAISAQVTDSSGQGAGYAFGYERYYRNGQVPGDARRRDAEGAPELSAYGGGDFSQGTMPWPSQVNIPPGETAGFEFLAEPNEGGFASKTRAIVVAGTLVALAAIIGIVGYMLGLWGGKIIPDVTGLDEPGATAALQEAGFAVSSVRVRSDEDEGRAVGTDPEAGSHAPEGSGVTLRIAEARFIPAIVDMNVDDALRLLEEAGYSNVTYEPYYTDGEEDMVVEVSPKAGTRAKSSMQVLIKVSRNYRVPDVSGMGLDEAVRAVEDAGLVADVSYIDTDQYPDGTVLGTAPEAGTSVSPGDYVSVTVTRMRGVELVSLTEEIFAEGNTVTIADVDYQIEKVVSMSYQGDDIVAFTASAKPYVSLFGETLFASSSQTISGQVAWSSDNEVVSIS